MSSPIIIAHRGASGYRPEHTLAAYELAIAQQADYIEPDLAITQDGILIIRHENEISGTTDVAERAEFRDRQTTKVIDGVTVTGWFTEDFTLAEIKTLRARERLRFRDQSFNDQFEIPTLQEAIELVQRQSRDTGRRIGIYPETKHPTYFRNLGLPLEEPLVEVLNTAGYVSADAPVFIQSFETANLQYLNQLTDVLLVQLLGPATQQPYDFVLADDSRTYLDLTSLVALKEIAQYADAIGPAKQLIVPVTPEGQLQNPTSLIEDAHTAGLLVHTYTFRNEAHFLAPAYQGQPEVEYEQFYQLGIDGIFTDFPDVAVAVRDRIGSARVRRTL